MTKEGNEPVAFNFTTQSTFTNPKHVAVIMDGNGRWALERGLPRTEGHRRGAAAVERTIQAALDLGLEALTLFAFSSDNWCRPEREVGTLMELFELFLRRELDRCLSAGIRLMVVGRRDRLPLPLRKRIAFTEEATATQTRLTLRIAMDYSARYEILLAVGKVDGAVDVEAVSRELHGDAAPVDLIIRTGRERRLSDFLLWEAAYAELYFLDTMWPDFEREDLIRAVESFQRRQRRFGRIDHAVEVAG